MLHLLLYETGIKEVRTVGDLVIVTSLVARGITGAPLTKLYGKRANDAPEGGLDGLRGVRPMRGDAGAAGRVAGTPGSPLG